MIRFIILFSLFSLLLLGCQSSDEKGIKIDEVKSEVTEQKKRASPYPAIPVGKGPDALFVTPDRNFLYVANVGDTLISVIDTKLDKVTKTIPGIRKPWGFSRLGESNLVAVSGYGKQVAVIDFTTHKIANSKAFESNLGGITSSSDGNFIYVVNITNKKVLQLNRALEIIARFDTGNGPDGIGISKDDDTLYVTNTEDGTISIINTDTKESSIIRKGGKPELIHSNNDNSLLLISNFFKDEGYILDTASNSITHTITDLNGPEDIILSRNGEKIYAVNFNNATVYTFDASDYGKLDQEYIVGAKPIGFAQVNEEKAYVSNYGDNTVSVISLTNN
jgi:YVTN family beta-propeller protein